MAVEHLESGAKIATLASAERIEFGPLAHYRPLMADGTTPVRTGIQVSEPGYVAQMHSHPYVEVLFIMEGEADVWTQGQEHAKRRLGPGDSVAMPAETPHSFAVVGDRPMKLLGIHHSPERIVRYLDDKTDANGEPIRHAGPETSKAP